MSIRKVFFLASSAMLVCVGIFGCSRGITLKTKQAQEHFEKRQYKKAIEILETVKPGRRTPSIDILLGKSYSALFEFNKANIILKEMLGRYPSSKDSLIKTYMEIARRFERRKRNDLSVKVYLSLLEVENDYNIGNGFYTLGHFYYLRNDVTKARQFFEKGVVNIIDRKILTKTKSELIDIYEKQGMLKEAFDISLDDPSGEIIFRRGKISYSLAKNFFSKNDFDSALAYCESVVKIKSPKTLLDDTYFLMGEIYSEEGYYTDAIKYYKEVVKLDKYGNNEIAAVARKKIDILTRLHKEGM